MGSANYCFMLLTIECNQKLSSVGSISHWDYLITQPFVIVQYFKTFILPTELSADTDWRLIQYLTLKLIMGILIPYRESYGSLAVYPETSYPTSTFGIFLVFYSLIPTSSIIPLSEVLNDLSRVYFPYIGLAIAFSL